ncbi:hypothetical protein Taro_032125 [Colocasia esculenta]|uniref:Uncharacterized protein n=1 Tax=Colocasia esculenta TaxID=4460 RepID=A0A843VWG6_COLES|nr:hypothetical protein [Colocasia esculenta]
MATRLRGVEVELCSVEVVWAVTDMTLVFQNSVQGRNSTAERTRIFFRTVIRTPRESPIRNRHFDPVGTRRELAITFRPCLGIAYVSTIQNLHSETVDRTLVLQNSVTGRNSTAKLVY